MIDTSAGPAAPPNGRADLRERPAGELVKDLSTQVSTLVRQELELAKVELTEKGKQAGIGAGMFGGAGLFALYGVGRAGGHRDPRAGDRGRRLAGGADRRRRAVRRRRRRWR